MNSSRSQQQRKHKKSDSDSYDEESHDESQQSEVSTQNRDGMHFEGEDDEPRFKRAESQNDEFELISPKHTGNVKNQM